MMIRQRAVHQVGGSIYRDREPITGKGSRRQCPSNVPHTRFRVREGARHNTHNLVSGAGAVHDGGTTLVFTKKGIATMG